MQLGVGDRLAVLSILPREGDLATVRIVHDLRQALSFTEEEHAAFEIRNEGEGVAWAADKDVLKDITIGPKAYVLIAETLERMNTESTLTEDHLGAWEKFCDEHVAV